MKQNNLLILANEYYIESRYPLGTPKVYSKKEAKEAIEAADKIINLISDITMQQ